MQMYLPFYDGKNEIKPYGHLDYLNEYAISDLQNEDFSKSILDDIYCDQVFALQGQYPQQEIADEIQLAIDYIVYLHPVLGAWLALQKAQQELLALNEITRYI